MDVSFRDAWVTVATGTLELEEVVIRDPLKEGSAFTVGRLEVSGPVEGLLFKNQPWPTLIRIDGTDPIRARIGQEGPQLWGSLADLVSRIQTTVKNRRNRGGPTEAGTTATQASFPGIQIRNALVILDSRTTGTTLLTLNLHAGAFYPAPDRAKDYLFDFRGMLGTATPAPATGRLRYHATDHLWEAQLTAENLDGSFPIEGNLQRLWWRVRSLHTTTRIHNEPEGELKVSVAAQSGGVELANGTDGTRPLYSGPLSIAVEASTNPTETTWTLQTAHMTGADLDITVGGEINAQSPHGFELDLAVTRIPGLFYRLAQQELAAQNAEIDFPTSAGLRLFAHVVGRPDRLTSSTITGRVSLDEIRVRYPLLPSPLTLGLIDGRLTGDGAELDIARWRMGGAGGSASARLDGFPFLGHRARLSSKFTVSGSAVELVRLGRTMHLIPSNVEQFDATIRGEGTVESELATEQGRLIALDPDWSARVSWVDGQLALADWQDTIRTETGAIQLTPGRLDIVRLRTAGGGLDVRWSGNLTGHPVFWVDPHLKLQAEGETTLPALARLLDFEKVGNTSLQQVEGKLRLNLNWEGDLARPEKGIWKAGLRARDIAFPLALRGDTANVHDLDFDSQLTSQSLAISNLRANVDDIAVEGSLTADENSMRFDGDLQAPVETVLRLFRRDLAEFRGSGVVPATASIRLEARKPLPSPTLPLPARWADALSKPKAIGLKDDNPIRPVLEATLFPDGASFYHEEMPHPVTNIRGRITADLTGLQIHHVLSKWGDVDDCVVDGRVVVGTFPVRVYFDIKAPRFDVLSWVDGWGHPADGRQTRALFRERTNSTEPRFMTLLEGTLHARELTLNRLKGHDAVGHLRYENWRNRENTLDVQGIRAEGYDGVASGTVQLTFPARGAPPRFNILGQFTDMDTQPFATDLFGREGQTVGRLHGYLRLGGQFNDLASFVGEGSVLLRNTRVLGGPIMPLLGKILKATVVDDITFSSIRGAYRIKNRQIIFERLFLDSPGVRLLSTGSAAFEGDLDMEVSVGFYSQTLNKIPGFNAVASIFRELGASFLKFHVTGTLTEPELNPVPFSADTVKEVFNGSSEPGGPLPEPAPTPTPRPPFSVGDGR